MDVSDEGNKRPRDRRAVFRISLKRLMDPLVEYIEDRFNVVMPMDRPVLRPPGALPERQFLDTCYRCGNCAGVCPARAIRTAASDKTQWGGTPYIDPDLAACVVCDDLACIKACPSGALRAVARPGEISMGLARVDQSLCVRGRGEDCTWCIEKCPVGSAALAVDAQGHIEVRSDGCVGCGACQFYCPVRPKAIVVDPW